MSTITREFIDELREKAVKANQEISRLCSGRGHLTADGLCGRDWTMCMPVQDTDSDVVLTAAIESMPLVLDALQMAITNNDYSICSYCGERGPRDIAHTRQHMANCPAHPIGKAVRMMALADDVMQGVGELVRAIYAEDDAACLAATTRISEKLEAYRDARKVNEVTA